MTIGEASLHTDSRFPGAVMAHHGSTTSSPDQDGAEQYDVHQHQVDNNLVLEGSPLLTLLNPAWDQPHHIIHLIYTMGALQSPIGTDHRSVSSNEGRLVLNQSMRDRGLDDRTEFIPVRLQDHEQLCKVKATVPWVRSWSHGHICRNHGSQ